MEDVSDVRPGDVLAYRGLSGKPLEAQVHSQALDVGRPAAWWVILPQAGQPGPSRTAALATALVARASNGSLREVEIDERGRRRQPG